MSEVSNNYNQIFTSGMSREEFIENYQKLASETEESTKNEKSVFLKGLDEKSIGLIYDTIHISKGEESLTDDDIQGLSALDGNSEDISDEDMVKLYEKIQETCKNTPVTTGPIDSDSKAFTPSESLGYLQVLKILKNSVANNKKSQLQNEISQLINNSNNISNDLKQEYNDAVNNTKEIETQLKEKQKEYELEKDKIQRIKEDISRMQGELETTQDESKKEQLQKDIEGYTRDQHTHEGNLAKISNVIGAINNSLRASKLNEANVIKKIERSDSTTAEKIREKQTELNKIDLQLTSDLADINKQITETERLQLEAVRQAGRDSAQYGNIANGTVSDGTVGKNAAQALANATSQIGVREETGHNDGAQIAKYRNGVDNNAAWCASFVSWCYKGNDVFGYQASVSGIQMAAQKQNLYAEKGSYTPKPGDVMIQKNGASHTGIVESVDPDGTIHTIEGNASNSVKRVTYKPGSKGYNQISGWVKMP